MRRLSAREEFKKPRSADMILENDTEMKNAEQPSYPARLFRKRQSIRK